MDLRKDARAHYSKRSNLGSLWPPTSSGMMEIGDAARRRLGQSKITSKLPAVELNAISASFMFADPKFESVNRSN